VRLAWVILLCGCNQFFELTPAALRDGDNGGGDDGGGGGNVDARPIIPADGTTSCSAPPDFESWTYAPQTIPFGQQISSFGLYRSTSDHMIVVPLDGSGIWDVELSGEAQQLPGLVPPAGKSISSVATSPDGAGVWFKIESATYVALRATGFTRQQTELGLPNAYEALPAAVAYYAGELRMIARVRDASSSPTTYVELSSTDGVTWTRGATLPFGGSGYYAAALSADGCILTFSLQDSGSTVGPYRSLRGVNGTFDTPVKLTKAAAIGSTIFNPQVSPNRMSMWFTAIGASSPLYRGAP
jgi:hypothetical protein